jgi:hypothetical protein
MLYDGILIGLIAFLVIGLFHPLIVKGERYFSYEIWPFFLFAGLIGLAAAVIARNILISSALGVFGFSALWSVGELFQQRERVRKGWFPAVSETAFKLRNSELPKIKFTARAIGESAFNLLYLAAILIIAVIIYPQPGKQLYGLACMVLFIGDACHLLPRIYALTHGGTDNFPTSVGIGKFITSLTMSAFYFMLAPNAVMLVLLLVRIALCVLPMNKWTGQAKPIFGIVRNIPLLAMGVIAAFALGFPYAIAIAASFLFYIPVVVFAHKNQKLGMLMLPKSCAYVALAVLLLVG